jgi:Na+/H+ antiporter NhaC
MKFTTAAIAAACLMVGTAYAAEKDQFCDGFGGCDVLACHCIKPVDGGHTRIAGQDYKLTVAGISFFDDIPQYQLIVDNDNTTAITVAFTEGKTVIETLTYQGVQALLEAEIEFDVPEKYTEAGLYTFTVVLAMPSAPLLAYGQGADGYASDPDVVGDWAIITAAEAEYTVNVIPGGVTLLPLICTLTVSALTREVYVALTSGIFVGAFIRYDFDFFDGLFKVFNVYIVDSIADQYHALTMLFTVLLGGLVAVMTKSGGAYGLAESVGRYASTPRYAQLSAYLSGWIIFFDDYANALVVGNTFRPITDMVKVSREKLAFIVDATSAPIASIMPVSAWIAYEVGLISDELGDAKYAARLEGLDLDNSGYLIFLETIPSRYYPFVMLFFQAFLILTGLEFGPMLTAERRSRYRHIQVNESGELAPVDLDEDDNYHGDEEVDPNLPDESTPRAWWNGVGVIVVLIILIITFMIISGLSYCDCEVSDLRGVFGNTDPFTSLVEGTVTTTILTFVFYRFQYKSEGRIVAPGNGGEQLLPFNKFMESFVSGMQHLMPAVFVLILAWAYGDLMKDIGTAEFFSQAVGEEIDGAVLPGITFILSSLIALATGTSWGTMAIMFPLVTSTALAKAVEDGNRDILLGTLSSVLAGSVFGDHCSPISDTTVLSSIATRCELQAHVLTQAPYAIFVGTITVIVGDFIGTSAGIPPVVGILLCTGVMMGLTLLIGAPVNSSTGRLDMFGRLYAAIAASAGRGDTLGVELQSKVAASEAAAPTYQFDPLGRFLGGGVTAYPKSAGYAQEVEDEKPKELGLEFEAENTRDSL